MLGAIIGDIVGSRFERNNYRGKDFELFADDCRITDDSVMTLAVAKAIMETEKKVKLPVSGFDFDVEYMELLSELTVKYMQEFGRKYPDSGYGGKFREWIFNEDPKPYQSFGNGAAMRISPAGAAARTEDEAISLSEAITRVTHNSEEGLQGAEAVAVAVFMARHGYTKEEIRNRISLNYYELDFTIDETRPGYKFTATCQGTVPQAIQCFVESTSFEDAVRTAVSLGGDSDTIAAIAGSIAEAYYGIPEALKDEAYSYLDSEQKAIVDEWKVFIGDEDAPYRLLTKYISKFEDLKNTVIEENDLALELDPEDEEDLFFSASEALIDSFQAEVREFIEMHPDFDYNKISEEQVLSKHSREITENTEALDYGSVLPLLAVAVNPQGGSRGKIKDLIDSGLLSNWLRRLRDLEWNASDKKLQEVYLEVGKVSDTTAYHLLAEGDKATLSKQHLPEEAHPTEISFGRTESELENEWNSIHTEYWKPDYPNTEWPMVYDAEQWLLFVRYEGMRGDIYKGDNSYPENWQSLLKLFTGSI